jgi:hypothetical protein
MNEKIKELAEQARAWVNNYENVAPDVEYTVYRDAYDKKFAELIVNECADWVKSRTLSNELKEGLKRHFGIKE